MVASYLAAGSILHRSPRKWLMCGGYDTQHYRRRRRRRHLAISHYFFIPYICHRYILHVLPNFCRSTYSTTDTKTPFPFTVLKYTGNFSMIYDRPFVSVSITFCVCLWKGTQTTPTYSNDCFLLFFVSKRKASIELSVFGKRPTCVSEHLFVARRKLITKSQ